ncbi:hypothetical protein LCL97_05560 [Seohaeicola saemankumensis]|nr:hypothetical protein [Seohaeicola saemankumensis]MCA0870279.1 hypothetical protein [Seohaeicola saemankumensis]
MKPDFALSLSFEGISLLHRAAGGWRTVGDVPLDVPDLAAALNDLRADAMTVAPDGFTCKVVIPNDQIRYLTVETGKFEGEARRAMVEQALDGATPYAVSDLVFDISIEGTRTHVAAVARETLAEAEAFAVEHQFNPISFVAIPGDKDFLGEPFFGPSAFASTLPGGTSVEADGIAIVVTGKLKTPVEPVVTEMEKAPAPEPAPDASGIPDAPPPTDLPEPEPEPAPQPEPGPDTDDRTHPDAVPLAGFSSRRGKSRGQAPALQGARRDETPPPTPKAAPTAEKLTEPVPSESQASVDVNAPVLDVPDTRAESASEPAPNAETQARGGFLSRRKAKQSSTAATAVADPGSAPVFQAQVVDVPEPSSETERMTVFGARENQKIGGKPRFLGLALTVGLLLFLAAVAAWASLFLDDGLAGLFRSKSDDAPQIAAPEADPATQAEGQQSPVLAPASKPEALPQSDAPLTSALTPPAAPTVDLSRETEPGRAAGLQLEQPEPGLSDTDRAVLEALSTPPTVVTPPSDPAAEDQLALAPDPGLDPELEPEPDDSPSSSVSAPPPMGAEARYAATGIWPEAPEEPETPSVIGLSDLFVASIDRTDLSQDAVALPSEAGLATDEPPSSVSSPAAAGTAFNLDQRGLVAPTVEGTVTPDGVTVYLGRPPRVPPPTPTRFETEPEVDTLSQRLAGFRPKPRPEGLVEQNERAKLGGRSLAELGKKRPKLRPPNLKDEVEEDDTPTAQAVVVSRVPKQRPRDFAKTVQSAEQRATPVAAASTAAVQTVAPVSVKPKIPSSASVARQATLDNAINLQRVNLIGVYGSPANRRALVRLPSGRYKKVKVGDTVDGGRVIAIGDSELRYQKSGRNMTLKIPSG